MNVVISVFGRFHAFNLANQLNEHGYLRRLITSYPKYETEKYGVTRDKIKALPHYEVLRRLWGRFPKKMKVGGKVDTLIKNAFDWGSSWHVPRDADIFVGWSGSSERGLARAKKMGAKAIVERGSSHIEYQRDLLKEESQVGGVNIDIPDDNVIAKEKREYEQADKIAVPSQFVKKSFVEKGVDRSKLIQVPYGVDVDEFRPIEKEDSTFRAIFAGQMMLRKGVHYLLKAFSDLELPNAELWLIGSKREEIEPYFEKYKEDFRFLGHKPQSELYKYYSQGSVFVMPSIEEGLAMVQPQAMACGLPLICTPNTGGEDLIREGKEGFIVPIRNVGALKERLLWCHENRENCRTMGDAARKRIEENFKWEDYGSRVVKAYSDLLDRD
ncbi:glycosyltransferase family 4 protein [Salinibacter ruber]|uniref:glycosyltransferase family 4 protein n=1 Tax=Salinibacter ruber TaxID=146919 RepID=UPI0020741D51|nr:glycosyltransferase family 4 protein [Salinibacter ruber]